MLQLFLITLVLVGIAFLAIGINIFFTKRGFPETEIGHNQKMKELGITCTKCEEWRRYKSKQRFKNLELDVTKISIDA